MHYILREPYETRFEAFMQTIQIYDELSLWLHDLRSFAYI